MAGRFSAPAYRLCLTDEDHFAMHSLIANARNFPATIADQREYYARLSRGQRPQALFICCSDSRVMPSRFTDAAPGELFEVRTAGNIVPPYRPDAGCAVGGSIEFALEALNVPEIVVCGHSHCGAVAGLAQPHTTAQTPLLRQWLDLAEYQPDPAADTDDDTVALARRHVLTQVDHLRGYPGVRRRLHEGRLRLHAWFYAIDTGRVSALSPRPARSPLCSRANGHYRPPVPIAVRKRLMPTAVSIRHALRTDLPASLVVFLVAVPLCVGVAVASGVPAELGLITGIVGGLVTGLLPGSSLQVSGPAAGLTVLVFEAVTTYGLAALGVIVVATGLLQLLLGLLRLGRWFRAISVAVVEGMLAGIGLIIIASQLYTLTGMTAPATGLGKITGLPAAAAAAAGQSTAISSLLVGAVTIAIIVLWAASPAGHGWYPVRWSPSR
ncbi:carbonic anhydrase [Actinoplanes sp. ATCC 53533]|uniref:carbonic anhydrase n=1 Tax=Actinoplanes sp. ATCC 53533 TaxID=1288362 RepID=UPI0018F5CB80|nr:carbonic anhydrase [Actinoplanes sp. ATCC 53533]